MMKWDPFPGAVWIIFGLTLALVVVVRALRSFWTRKAQTPTFSRRRPLSTSAAWRRESHIWRRSTRTWKSGSIGWSANSLSEKPFSTIWFSGMRRRGEKTRRRTKNPPPTSGRSHSPPSRPSSLLSRPPFPLSHPSFPRKRESTASPTPFSTPPAPLKQPRARDAGAPQFSRGKEIRNSPCSAGVGVEYGRLSSLTSLGTREMTSAEQYDTIRASRPPAADFGDWRRGYANGSLKTAQRRLRILRARVHERRLDAPSRILRRAKRRHPSGGRRFGARRAPNPSARSGRFALRILARPRNQRKRGAAGSGPLSQSHLARLLRPPKHVLARRLGRGRRVAENRPNRPRAAPRQRARPHIRLRDVVRDANQERIRAGRQADKRPPDSAHVAQPAARLRLRRVRPPGGPRMRRMRRVRRRIPRRLVRLPRRGARLRLHGIHRRAAGALAEFAQSGHVRLRRAGGAAVLGRGRRQPPNQRKRRHADKQRVDSPKGRRAPPPV